MSKFQTMNFDDEQQLALTANCIESLLTSDDLLGDMLDCDEFDLSFTAEDDGFPVVELSSDEDSSQSNHSSSVEDPFFTSDLDNDDDVYTTDSLPSDDGTCRAVSPEPTSISTPNVSMSKLAECMERTALSRSLVEKYCKSSLTMKDRKLSRRRSSMKGRVQQRRRSILLVKALKEQGMEPQKAMKLVSNAVSNINRVDSSIGSFLRKQKNKSNTSKLINSQENGNFRSSGLKLSKKKLDFLNKKMLKPLKKQSPKIPLQPSKKEQVGGIASFLRRQQLDISVLEL